MLAARYHHDRAMCAGGGTIDLPYRVRGWQVATVVQLSAMRLPTPLRRRACSLEWQARVTQNTRSGLLVPLASVCRNNERVNHFGRQ